MAVSSDRRADLIVIGGGSAGICAAVAAARSGADVVLLEKSPLLGGMGSLAFVNTFCGLYMPDVSRPPRLANPGLPAEIERLMRKHTNQSGPLKMGKVYVLPQQPEVYDRIAKNLTTEAGVELALDCACTGISRTNDGFCVAVNNQNIRCQSLVDCSADAVAAGFLGASRHRVPTDQLQRPAIIFAIDSVGAEAAQAHFSMRLALDLVHAVRDGELPPEILGATIRESPQRGKYFISIDLKGEAWDPTDEHSKALTRSAGEKLGHALCVFLRRKYDFFKQSTGPEFAPCLGVRESYRWHGQYELTGRDLIEGKEFTDTVAYATWPLELREHASGPKFKYFAEAKPSGIPLRSLVSAEIPGVFFAGRCLSASHDALASVRVMGTCFATGQAAGMAAALHAEGVTQTERQAEAIRNDLGFC